MQRPLPIPVGRTARRLTWPFLPPHLRALIEQECGAAVVDAVSQDAGFTPGFASVLTCADGSRHFVKAASVKAQRPFAHSYREEARKLAALPPLTPAPRLLWSHDDDWMVLGIEYVDAVPPSRPWLPDQLEAALDTLATMAEILTPAPAHLELDTFADEFASLATAWERVRSMWSDLPHADRIDEATELAAGFAAVTTGETLVHTDLRDDNLLLRPDGTALVCDWNWPVAGAAWLDSLLLLIGPRGDGIDVERVIADRALLAEVPAESIDRVLALLTGYFLTQCAEPVPPTSPHLRDFQRWQGEVVWHWLAQRRGWSG